MTWPSWSLWGPPSPSTTSTTSGSRSSPRWGWRTCGAVRWRACSIWRARSSRTVRTKNKLPLSDHHVTFFFFVKLQILIFIFFLDKFLKYVPTYFQKALFIYRVYLFLINFWNMSLPIFKKALFIFLNRTWTKALSIRRHPDVPCLAGSKPVPAGYDQYHGWWRGTCALR